MPEPLRVSVTAAEAVVPLLAPAMLMPLKLSAVAAVVPVPLLTVSLRDRTPTRSRR